MTITINSILDGIAESFYLGGKSSFNFSLAIDPDQPTSAGNVKSSGVLVPVGYSKFSGANLTGYPKWIETNNKNALVYVYDSIGKFLSYNSSLASETAIATIATSSGNGMRYYNDYIYLFRNTDVDRYGPLSGSPSLTSGVWTGATLGTQTALVNSSYPTLRGCSMPNHPAVVHGDGALYFCDYASGQGLVHKILTTATGTNNGSAYNVLDLPFGYYPTCIESYGQDLVIGAIQTSSDVAIIQGKAAIFFWNAVDASFYRKVELQDPIISAMKITNGMLYVFSGNTVGGVRASKYLGGEVLQQMSFQDEGFPPFAGAVEAMGNKILWGGFVEYPEKAAVVFAYNSRTNIPMGLHCIARSTSSGANGNVTAIKAAQQGGNLVIGWGDDA